MSRLDKRKQRSVIQEISTDTEDLSQFKRITITMRKQDIKDIENYISKEKDSGVVEAINKSLVIRKALRLLYKQNKPFQQI